ncbi:ice-binding family protein [Candidatus Nitrosacidococcus tergens]|uniref:Ice-binding protein C-terminal domain-containing protein n=1 Tax=Candidatus Nitrosacidococcus tergens TaxID=553981 RepID=A0A7G1Q7F5_9GAMM|nr:ice-binding family protein [Candidatus Nitrosacidococcus tergens]CAB1274249.1 conserved exported protein of unknown function [Candidatus Nitrosacidococcus tergens]
MIINKRLLILILFGASSITLASPISLGNAGNFAALTTGGGITISGSKTITGNVGTSDDLKLSGSRTINGDTEYANNFSHTGTSTASSYTQKLDSSYWNDLYSDIQDASNAAKSIPANETLTGDIKKNTTLSATEQVSVFDISGKIDLSGSKTLTLSGSATDEFIINVAGDVSLSGSSAIILTGGLTADHVLFNVIGNFSDSGSGTVAGTFLLPNGSFDISGSGVVNGSILAGGNSKSSITGSATVNYVSYSGFISDNSNPNDPGDSSNPTVPEPSSLLMMLLGLIGLKSIIRSQKAIAFSTI